MGRERREGLLVVGVGALLLAFARVELVERGLVWVVERRGDALVRC
jgi:hypothetical protein